jgi:hypothetical protein
MEIGDLSFCAFQAFGQHWLRKFRFAHNGANFAGESVAMPAANLAVFATMPFEWSPHKLEAQVARLEVR